MKAQVCIWIIGSDGRRIPVPAARTMRRAARRAVRRAHAQAKREARARTAARKAR